MFCNIRRKLSLICCFFASIIVLIIIFCCLKVSEKNMYEQEKSLFFLKSNTISHDLQTIETISISWYQRVSGLPENILYIEANGSPSILSNMILSDLEYSLIDEIKKYQKNNRNFLESDHNLSQTQQQYFQYTKNDHHFLVMNTKFSDKKKQNYINFIYLYNLNDYFQNVRTQRIRFVAIWLVSILFLYLFSYVFTTHVLRPVMENDNKQKHFIAVASHELRSPLAVFKTGLSILKKNIDTEKEERICQLMDSEMARMERLIGDLLCLTKTQQATLDFQFESVNLVVLLNNIYEKYFDIAKDKQLTLTLSIKESDHYNCLCDPQRIEQVITILLDNALCYTPPGETILLNLFRSHSKYYIQVIDSGMGIPDIEKAKIFDRFYQSDPSHNQKKHFGLGLSIAKEICNVHGAKISVSDTKGGGSTFTVKLPLK